MVKPCEFACIGVNDHDFVIVIAQQEACVRVDQRRGVCVQREILKIDFARFHQFMNKRQDEQAICARRDAYPFVSHSVIARADRVNADHFGAASFDFADTHFDWVGVVVFGNTEQHEQFGVIPVRLAEFPERAAHGVDAACCHVHRAEAAVCRKVWRTKALCPHASERLGLVTASKEGQLFRVLFADWL